MFKTPFPLFAATQLLTKLEPGSSFGGGPGAMGDGEMQSSLKATAETDVELYHMHIDTFLRHASLKLISLFRRCESRMPIRACSLC